jgi:putative tricarboxylic transport membrane protein
MPMISRLPAVSRLCAAFALAGAVALPVQAADTWKPDRTIELIIAATPGGGYDNLARPMQKILGERKLVDVNILAINKPGAGGAIGWNYLNQRPNEGHAISIISGTILGANIMGQMDTKYTDFTTLPMIFNEYVGFHVRPDSPIKNANDMIERLKKDPMSLSMTPGTSVGTLPHVAFALVLKKAGFKGDMSKLTVVAFKSTGEAAIAVAGGHVDILATRPSNVAELIKAGRLRTLAVTAPTRMPGFPDVPTWKELGVDAVYGNWFGMIGPRNMTPAQIAYWDDTFLKLTRTDEWKREVERNQWTDFYMTSAQSRKFLDQQNEELRVLMTDIGLAAK